MEFSNIRVLGIFNIFVFLTVLSISHIDVSQAYSVNNETKTWLPKEELIAYFDSNGVYTVGGNVKNQNNFAVLPVISVSVIDGDNRITKTISHVPIPALTDIPFKMKFPEVQSSNPELIIPILTFKKIEMEKIPVEVVYDKTLKKHDDGHVTGHIKNTGNQTIFYPKVFAIVNGHDNVLDITQNIEFIEKIEPGEIVKFSMYPDPSITEAIFYYSCFAVTDSFVRPVYTERNGEKFYFRYDSGSWYTAPQFNERGTEITMRTQNSFPIGTYANFEFPSLSKDEKLSVFVNDQPKKIIQSIDERKNWHVAFNVEPLESGVLKITGFKEGWNPGETILVPDWIKVNAAWWAEGQIEDEIFVRGIEFMIKENIITVSSKNETQYKETDIPGWFRNNASWWSQDKIESETFVNGLEYLLNQGIIQI